MPTDNNNNKLIEHLSRLVKLQKVDTQKLLLLRENETLPTAIKEYCDSLEKTRKKLETADSRLDAESKKKKQLERELQTETEKIAKKQSRISELKTNKEYQTHLHEIEIGKQLVSSIEDTVLETFEKIDMLEKERELRRKECETKEKELDDKKVKIEKRMKTIKSAIRKLDKEYDKFEAAVDKKLLKEYYRIRENNRGIGIVEVKNGVCYGCHLSLTPQFTAEIKKRDNVYRCPHCTRLIYWQEPKQEPKIEETKAEPTKKGKVNRA